MKRYLCLVITIALLTLSLINTAFAETTLTASIVSRSGYRGQTLSVPINLSGVLTENIGNMQLKFYYDTNSFSVDQVTPGSIVTNSSSNFFSSIDTVNGAVTLLYCDLTCGSENITQTGTIANISLRIKDTTSYGTYAIQLDPQNSCIGDNDLNSMPFYLQNGSITVLSNNQSSASSNIISAKYNHTLTLDTSLLDTNSLFASSVTPVLVASSTSSNMPNDNIIGDVSCDGRINSIDFATMRKYLLGMISGFGTVDTLWVGDVDADQKVASTDFAYERLYILGMISQFPKNQNSSMQGPFDPWDYSSYSPTQYGSYCPKTGYLATRFYDIIAGQDFAKTYVQIKLDSANVTSILNYNNGLGGGEGCYGKECYFGVDVKNHSNNTDHMMSAYTVYTNLPGHYTDIEDDFFDMKDGNNESEAVATLPVEAKEYCMYTYWDDLRSGGTYDNGSWVCQFTISKYWLSEYQTALMAGLGDPPAPQAEVAYGKYSGRP